MRLWDFALAAWERPGVSEICLRLQDRHEQCIPLLLWRAWVAAEGRDAGGELVQNAIALARTHEREMIAPLRAARRAQGTSVAGPLSEAARQAELGAERALLNALEALTSAASPPPSASADDLGHALATLIRAWNGSKPTSVSRALAARLR